MATPALGFAPAAGPSRPGPGARAGISDPQTSFQPDSELAPLAGPPGQLVLFTFKINREPGWFDRQACATILAHGGKDGRKKEKALHRHHHGGSSRDRTRDHSEGPVS